jgi:flagellar motor switch protein FliG
LHNAGGYSDGYKDGYTSGIKKVVEILQEANRATERQILDALEIEDAELAERIRSSMFTFGFEDIASLDARSLQTVIRFGNIDQRDWAVALKGATKELLDIVMKNQSKRSAEMLKEDMDYIGPVRKRDVEEAQDKIIDVIRRLQDMGEIVILRGGGDEIIA